MTQGIEPPWDRDYKSKLIAEFKHLTPPQYISSPGSSPSHQQLFEDVARQAIHLKTAGIQNAEKQAQMAEETRRKLAVWQQAIEDARLLELQRTASHEQSQKDWENFQEKWSIAEMILAGWLGGRTTQRGKSLGGTPLGIQIRSRPTFYIRY